MSADGAAAGATAPQTQAPPTGGSIISDAARAAPAAPPPIVPGTAEAALKDAQDGPPDWAPEKFWDRDKRQLKHEDLGRSYKSLEQLLGRDKVPVPTGDDDKEGWERWYKASGTPDKPEDYEWQRPKEMPAGMEYSEDMEKNFRNIVHQNKLNKKQAANLYDQLVKVRIDEHVGWHKMQRDNRANAEVALRRELGNDYEGWVSGAGSVFKAYGDPEFEAYINESGIGNDPRLIKVFGRIAKDLNGDTKLRGRAQPQATPADIDKSIAEFRGKHSAALFDRSHPDNERLSTELQRLYGMKFPEQAA